MELLLPIIIVNIIFALGLCFLYQQHRNDFYLPLILFWLSETIKLIFSAFYRSQANLQISEIINSLHLAGYTFFSLASAYFLFWMILAMHAKKIDHRLVMIPVQIFAWLLFAIIARIAHPFISYPLNMCNGIVYALCGMILVIRSSNVKTTRIQVAIKP